MTPRDALVSSLAERLVAEFGSTEAVQLSLAPGRVNLIGEHTDYNDGWALPMAIDRHVGVAFRARSDRRARALSLAYDEIREVNLEDRELRVAGWAGYLAGMAWMMSEAGLELRGMDCVIGGNVPLGAGLSSSAALEMAVGRALCAVAGIAWRPRRMAELAWRAENEYIGVNCGPMDQLASSCARQGAALLLDCRSLETEIVPLPAEAAVVVMDTGSRRSLAASEYNARRASCEEAVAALRSRHPGLRALRDVTPELLEMARDRLSETTFRRAEHVVRELRRPGRMAAALRAGDLERAGRLMDDSHASLRDLYQVSSPELDRMTELARGHGACFGARLTGAGFGGCAVALVAAEGAEAFVREVASAYTTEIDLPAELFVCSPVAGAGLERLAQPGELSSESHEREASWS